AEATPPFSFGVGIFRDAPSTDEPDWTMAWKNHGLWFEKGKDFSFHVGGMIQYDAVWFATTDTMQQTPGPGRFQDGVAPRRLRMRTEGTLYENFEFLLEFDFGNHFLSPDDENGPEAATFNVPALTDAYVTIKQVPWLGKVRIGNQREPFTLELQNSSRYLTFMERSYLFDALSLSGFSNGRQPGILFLRTWAEDRLFGSAGVFKSESNAFGFGLGDGDYAITSRWGLLPLWRPEDESWWWLGAAYSHRDPANDMLRARARNSVRGAPATLANVIADTGVYFADSEDLFNLQTAASLGSFTLQSEYVATLTEGARATATSAPGNLAYHGAYAELSYLLTGEHRSWDAANARMDPVVPKRPWKPGRGECGRGAWEIGCRFQILDLVDAPINGGRLQNATLGVNWYWNPNMKMQFNYDYLWRDPYGLDPARGSVHGFGTRMAVFF
ncbi:MAG TPA: porin, partial [Planctomycetia bacterium]|nr:porin [Planctomycetia bacterium]